jgi:hypothetical protein
MAVSLGGRARSGRDVMAQLEGKPHPDNPGPGDRFEELQPVLLP